MFEDAKKEIAKKRAVHNRSFKEYYDVYANYYGSAQAELNKHALIRDFVRDVAGGKTEGMYKAIKKIPDETLLDMLYNYFDYYFQHDLIGGLSEENEQEYIYHIMDLKDFEERIDLFCSNPWNNDLLDKKYIDALNEKGLLHILLKKTPISNNELESYAIDLLIKKHGKDGAIKLLGPATNRSFDHYKVFLEKVLTTKRPNYDINLESSYYNNNYYFDNYIFDTKEEYQNNYNYISMFKIIDIVIDKYVNEYNSDITDLYELIKATNDEYLINYFTLKSFKFILSYDHSIKNINKYVFKGNEDLIRRFLLETKENIKMLDVCDILFYRYDLDIDFIKTIISKYNINDEEILKIIQIYVDRLKNRIDGLLNSKITIKKTDEVEIFENEFKHVLKFISIYPYPKKLKNEIVYLIKLMNKVNNKINLDLNIFTFICDYKIENDDVSKEVVDSIIGVGNEVNYQNIYRYEKEILSLKYLDNNSLIKLTKCLISLNDKKLLFKFLENNSKHFDITVLKDIILNTNDKDIIAEYVFLTSDVYAISLFSEKINSSKYEDKDAFIKYAVEHGIAKTYDFKFKK